MDTNTAISEKKFSSDLQYAYSWVRMCLRCVGLYPDPDADLNSGRRPYPWLYFGVPITVFQLILPQVGRIFEYFGHPFLMPSAIITFSIGFTAMSKLFVTWIHAHEIHAILGLIVTDWRSPKTEEQRAAMLKFAKGGRNSIAASAVMLILILTFHIMFNMVLVYETRAGPVRHLIYPNLFPYDAQKTPYYELTITGQCLAAVFTGIANTTFDSLIAVVSMHTSGQLVNLRRVFENLAEEAAETEKGEGRGFSARLSWAIKRHQDLMKMIKMLNKCYSKVLLLQIFGTVAQLCFLALQIFFVFGETLERTTVLKLMRLLVFVFTTTTNLFIGCYAAQRLCDESTNLRHGVYACKWYNLAPCQARPLILVMCRCLVPLQITVGDFAVYSLDLFGTIVRSSMGYVSVFLSVMT